MMAYKKVFLTLAIILVNALFHNAYPKQQPYKSTHPTWSSDGSKIAFSSIRKGFRDIYLMNADGSNPINFTKSEAIDFTPAWSPDGTKLAFTSNMEGIWEIYTIKPDGTDLKKVADGHNHGILSWSPDAARIAFCTDREDGNHQIYTMSADGSKLTKLTDNPAQDKIPIWSPGGSKIAFKSERDGNFEIYMMNSDGLNKTRITYNQAHDRVFSWSPDGKKLAFDSDRDEKWNIYVMDADGTDPTRLTNHPSENGGPAFSPDGKRIAFVSNRDGQEEIYVINIDGTGETRLTFPPEGEISFITIIRNKGIDHAIELYQKERYKDPSKILFHAGAIGNFEHTLLYEKQFDTAIKVFTLYSDTYPESADAYKGLAEAYMKSGNKELAIKNYEKSLELNPDNTNAKMMLKKLNTK